MVHGVFLVFSCTSLVTSGQHDNPLWPDVAWKAMMSAACFSTRNV